MTSLPVLDLPDHRLDSQSGSQFEERLRQACSGIGAFQLRAPQLVKISDSLLDRARTFFALPFDEKQDLLMDKAQGIYTGYSVLKNDRDWREQYHLLMNQGESIGKSTGKSIARYEALKSAPLLPSSLPSEWIESVELYISTCHDLVHNLFTILTNSLDDSIDSGSSHGEHSYSLLKLINYLEPSLVTERLGTPPHIDWSWLTLVTQDRAPGLMIMSCHGDWIDVSIEEDCFIVLVGELLEVATSGIYRAAPHRVILPTEVRSRLSAPFFFCPDLSSTVQVAMKARSFNPQPSFYQDEPEHIHRVFDCQEVDGDFHFGASEYNRKVLGRWCYRADCCG